MTAWEKIRDRFEAGSTCRYSNKPKVHCEPGCTWIECDRGDDCKCRIHQDSSEPLTPTMAEWSEKFS